MGQVHGHSHLSLYPGFSTALWDTGDHDGEAVCGDESVYFRIKMGLKKKQGNTSIWGWGNWGITYL